MLVRLQVDGLESRRLCAISALPELQPQPVAGDTRAAEVAMEPLATIAVNPISNYSYAASNGQVTITGYLGAAADVVIPDTIDGMPVTAIGYLAFYNRPVRSVQLPSSITTVGPFAFYRCPLTSVNVPAAVASIGDRAFSRCGALTAIEVDSANATYASVGGVLFSKDLATVVQYPGAKAGPVVLPDSVRAIGGGAFEGCRWITSVLIPRAVHRVGSGAFTACSSLQAIAVDPVNQAYSSRDGALLDKTGGTLLQFPAGRRGVVSLPAGITVIGSEALAGCSGLTRVTVPLGVRRLEDKAFFECSGLVSIQLPAGLSAIGSQAFDGCRSLVGVTIPQGVTELGQGVFNWCASLRSVSLPSSVSSIGAYRFHGCTSLTAISIDPRNPFFAVKSGLLVSKDGTRLIKCPGGVAGVVNVPAGVKTIEDNAFALCSRVTGVTMPASVTAVGPSAFSGCSSLTRISLSSNITSIRAGTFSGCTSLTEIPIPPSVREITSSAFADCSSLLSLSFQGDAPAILENSTLERIGPQATAYYRGGTRGWANAYGGVPAKAAGVPAAVQGLVCQVGNRSARLNWQPPPTSNGSPIVAYQILYARQIGDGYGPWISRIQPASSPTRAVISGLVNGATYTISVVAVNAFGPGSNLESAVVVTPMTVPGAPTKLVATAGSGQVTLTWRAPISTGGAAVVDYRVEYRLVSRPTWTTVARAPSSALNATISGLDSGATYLFRVSSQNAAGSGSPSSVARAIDPLPKS